MFLRYLIFFLSIVEVNAAAHTGFTSCEVFIRQQENFYHIPMHLLKAISLIESGRTKNHISAYWWNALYQQAPIPAEGNVFKVNGLRYYLTKDLPATFEQVICSWDCTFKDTDGSDFVVGQVWAKSGANAYLLDQVRARMSFTATRDAVVKLRNKWPLARVVLIEDKANGPAVIDELKKTVFGILPVEPDGSKLARAHAITALWEAGNIWLPHKDLAPWIGAFIAEILGFPAGAHDDQVDTMTQGVRHLFPVYGRILISADALEGILRG